jgi:hypothetical protein
MDFRPLFERPIHAGIETAARYCREIAVGRDLPRRQDFRPTKVRSILGHMFLLDVLAEENDYRYSLCGVNISVLIGVDGTNKRMSDLPQTDMSARLKKTYDDVVAARSFLYVRGQYNWPNRAVNIERLLVPMTNGEGKLQAIFGVVISDCPADMLVIYAGAGMAKLVIDEAITGNGCALPSPLS